MRNTGSVVVAEGLGKRFGNRWIFRRLEMEVSAGQRLAILGPNGSGKSTLLKTLAGLLSPTEGKVRLPEGDARRTLGYSGLDMALYPYLSVAEHLEMSGALRSCAARTEELLNRVGLWMARDVPARQLSSGMRARLKLCLAIQPDPLVLLLDEPGASMDENGRNLIWEIAEEQVRRGCLIVATNDPLERRLATHELDLGN
ncbi:MAG TPA: ABC transporter ATP-binding protein [Fimbriimonas sp.]|nr:ABC transporter ATP-binding protein [Fimbriimonas sp.]